MIIPKGMRLYLTENCDASCPWCFNKNTRDPNKDMDTEKCKKLIDYLAEHGIKKLRIMGGEPTMHPDFVEIWKHSYNKFNNCVVYTNGHFLDKIKEILPYYMPGKHIINFNFAHLNSFSNPELFTKLEFICTEVVIKLDTNPEKLIAKIQKLNEDARQINLYISFVLTIDCTLNIFKYKKEILDRLIPILTFAENHQEILWSWDHKYPKCILTAEVVQKIGHIKPERTPITLHPCYSLAGCSGLITSNFKLVHCNQYQHNKLDLFTETDNLVPFKTLCNFLTFEGYHKLESLRNTSCASCFYFGTQCTGGCVAHKFEH